MSAAAPTDRYPITPAIRDKITAVASDLIDAEDPKVKLGAMKILNQCDALNARREEMDKGPRQPSTQNIQFNVQVLSNDELAHLSALLGRASTGDDGGDPVPGGNGAVPA